MRPLVHPRPTRAGWPLVLACIVSLATLAASGVSAQPARLSQTGLASAQVMSFEPQYPLWSDGTSKRRWIHIPAGRFVDARNPDAWIFPVGTRLWKEFAYGGRVETRFNERLPNGQWRFATYIWRADGSEADLAPATGAVLTRVDAPQGRYELPSQADCANCHAGALSPVLGFSALQVADLLPQLIERGLVRGLPAAFRLAQPRIVADSEAERQARGYLHGNCGHCHHPQGVPVPLLLAQGVAGTAAPSTAQLAKALRRMESRNPMTQMPPLGTRVADARGLALVQGWLDSGLVDPGQPARPTFQPPPVPSSQEH